MTYEYFCPNCDAVKSDWHNISEDPEIKCDACNIVMKHKITGGAGTHYKGFGWTTAGSKDGTQSHHKPVSQMEMAVPASMNGIVSDEAKKSASSVAVKK